MTHTDLPAAAPHSLESLVSDWSTDQEVFKKVHWGKAMMWIFLLGDTFIFSCFLTSYMTVRASTTATWPDPGKVFVPTVFGETIPLIPIAIMTFILISSSGTMAAAVNSTEGGKDGVGPNLRGVIGRDIGSRTSFTYSSALAGKPGNWTIEKLDAYLLNPDKEIPGDKMAFQGVKSARDRADVIAYPRTLGAADIPLPEPATAAGNEAQQGAPRAE